MTAEQSVRLAMLDSVERQKAIECIVMHIRKASHRRNGKSYTTPRTWYAMPSVS